MNLYKLFSDINASNEMLISQIEENYDKIQLIFPPNIRPTRKNVIDNKFLNLVNGGVNYFASAPLPYNVTTIDSLIMKYANERDVEVEVDLIIKLLKLLKIENVNDFNSVKYISCLQGLITKRPQIKCKLLVRTNRDIARGTGTMLSPLDRNMGEAFKKEVVFTMYRIIGSKEKGWDGSPIWMPNIKFPHDTCFYDIEESII